jgi:hypothetical protein
VALRPLRRGSDRGARGGDALLEDFLSIRIVRVAAEPVSRARELPGGFEIVRLLLQPLCPDPFRGPGAREVVAVRVQGIGVLPLRNRGFRLQAEVAETSRLAKTCRFAPICSFRLQADVSRGRAIRTRDVQ